MLKTNKSHKKLLLYLFVFILILSLLRIFILSKETKFDSLNPKNIDKIKNTIQNNSFSFIVLGNIKNSLLIFNNANSTNLNNDNAAFIVSNGNAVINGNEFKFSSLNKKLKKIAKHFIIGFGKNEKSDEGDERFYHHFGSYYFSFQLRDSYFIFLDTTGKTPIYLQKDWLRKELESSLKYKYRFVFMQKSLIIFEQTGELYDEDFCILDVDYRKFLINIFQQFRVTAVFSGAAPIFYHTVIGDVNYLNSGCAGGTLLLDNPDSYYHYIKVKIGSQIEYEPMLISKGENSFIHKLLTNIFYYLDSFIYLSFINYVLILSAIFIVLTYIYKKLSKPVNYYRNFDNNKIETTSRKLKIVMFSNNYLPFIGGVTISIKRLAEGLRNLGHQVYIFAPQYRKSDYGKYREEAHIYRFKPLFYYKKSNLTIPIPNIFSANMKKKFLTLKPDIVHFHHPYWMGNISLKWAKKYNIPTVLTYHTRLELYSHNLPVFNNLFSGKIPHELIKNFANQCDVIIAPTTTAKEYLRNLGVGKIIEIIPTGIDFSSYNSPKKDIALLKKKYHRDCDIILFSVSRLSKEKNLYFLLNGIKYLAENTTISFKTLIAGDGPEREGMLEFIKHNKLEEKVILLGSVSPDEISKYFMLADIFVFTSKSETQGMVLLEAMAGKTPIVAIRSSGIDDIVKNGFNGFKTEEDVAKWAEKVMDLMENPESLLQFSENALNFSKSYSKEVIAEKILKTYFEILKYKID